MCYAYFMEPPRKSRLPLFFASIALVFLLGGLIIQQTMKGNREKVEIIQNSKIKTQNDSVKFKINNPTSNLQLQFPISNIQSPTSQDEQVLGGTENIGKISVNDAIFEELDVIPGVGPKTAEKIINGRPWKNLEDVLNLINKRYREEARGKLKL